jgi:hypothetical protein
LEHLPLRAGAVFVRLNVIGVSCPPITSLEGPITMKAISVRVIPVALLLMAMPSFALHKTHHLNGHASIRHASLHGRATARTEHHAKIEAMPSERATEIQTALIKQGYLNGEPSGSWDAQSVAAMQKLQADNGWQTRLTPDSRALIKLGLGPQRDSLAQTSVNQQ